MHNHYYPTGNAYVALPTINDSGALESFNVISMADRGLLEVTGDPFLTPRISIDGEQVDMAGLSWSYRDHWIPEARLEHAGATITLSYVAPQDTRGWFLRVGVSGAVGRTVSLQLDGHFAALLHSINETKPCRGEIETYESLWNEGLMFDFRATTTKISFGFLTKGGFDAQTDLGAGRFRLDKTIPLDAEGNGVQDIFMGVGLDEVGAATQAIHMRRETGDVLIARLCRWLEARTKSVGDTQLDAILNLNQFFNCFYATGTSFDTEETVLCTSRSPRYYVSAAYWDRDSLIWSFPALLATDPGRAKDALDYVFGKQIRNVGIHSRYIDGTVLEPGFELDELCAPLLALDQYVTATGDEAYLRRPEVVDGLVLIRKRLDEWKHPEIALYGTFLMPTDDMRRYPYLTYCNVLVWRALGILAGFARIAGDAASADTFDAQARDVREAIWAHCTATHDGQRVFVWSADLEGRHDIYDEPPGSLTLLAYYGFCDADDPVFLATRAMLYSDAFPHYFGGTQFEELGCTHADYPWVLAIANSLLNGRAEQARDMLRRAPMDSLIACEAIDAETGEWATGAHFATCAGWLVHALLTAHAADTA